MTGVGMDVVDVSILIVNWNSADYVRECVTAIPGAIGSLRYEVVVIDNASFDNCGEILRTTFPNVRFLQSGTNLGFGGANNALAAMSSAPVLLFLNPDTIPTALAFERMWQELKGETGIGIVGCRLLNTDRTVQTSCVQALPTVLNQFLDADLLRWMTPGLRLWGTSALRDTCRRSLDVEAVSGACMMVRREAFEAVEGFSPAFFMYGEDIDLCARVANAGWAVRHVGDAEVIHHGGGSSRHAPSTFAVVTMCESISLLVRRHHGAGSAAVHRVASTAAAALRLVILLASWPVWIFAGGVSRWHGAWQKWTTVLRWNVGLAVKGVPARPAGPTDEVR